MQNDGIQMATCLSLQGRGLPNGRLKIECPKLNEEPMFVVANTNWQYAANNSDSRVPALWIAN